MKTGIYIGLGALVVVGGWFAWQWWNRNKKPVATDAFSRAIAGETMSNVAQKLDPAKAMQAVKDALAKQYQNK